MKSYQVAIIGTNIGSKHYEDFQKVSGRFKIHTLCGLTKSVIKKILPANSETKVSINFDEVLKDKEIDIVDICLPPHLHFLACKKSLEAGCNLVLYCAGNINDNLKLIKSVPYIDKFTSKKTSEIYKILG